MKLKKELKIAIQASIKAGYKILEYYDDNKILKTKDENDFKSPLTKADLEANKIIVDFLRKNFPDHSILTEEEKDDLGRLNNNYVWIIDPLDGTKEFINKNGEFTVNIALTYRQKPVLGVIYIPVKDELFYSLKDVGAYHMKNMINNKKISVSDKDRISDMILMVSRSHSGKDEDDISKRFKKTIPAGSSLKGCLVAKGVADCYFRFGNTSEWDICAMNAILDEAGGKITDLNGKNILYNKKEILINGFIVSNNKIHDKLVDLGNKK